MAVQIRIISYVLHIWSDWIRSWLRNASFLSCVLYSFSEQFIWESHGGKYWSPLLVGMFVIALYLLRNCQTRVFEPYCFQFSQSNHNEISGGWVAMNKPETQHRMSLTGSLCSSFKLVFMPNKWVTKLSFLHLQLDTFNEKRVHHGK